MQKTEIRKLIFLPILLTLIINPSEGQITDFGKIKWTKERIAKGLVWKSSHTLLNDSVPQNINILVVNLKKRSLSLAYNPLENSATSSQAEKAQALAAINGGFFNIADGGSVTYIKINGVIVDKDTAKQWVHNENRNGSILINGKSVVIREDMTNEWFDSQKEFDDILVAGPLLLRDGKPVKLPETSLTYTKHPRSAVGILNKHKVMLITVDGRTSESHGMSLNELQEFLNAAGCRDGLNLDGGGSTTMWVSGKPFNGVVNMPCDNKKFDHLGERPVSDILIVK